MRYLILFFLLLSGPLFAAKHTMVLTLIDGYTNQPIINQEVIVRFEAPSLTVTTVTDAHGSITLTFKAKKHFISYSFACASGDFEPQERNRYLENDPNPSITFYMYPSEQYERRIAEVEARELGLLEWNTDEACLPPFMGISEEFQAFIYNNLQTPASYGDLGFEAHFELECILTSKGQLRLIRIISSTDEELNKEAIRLLRAMPAEILENCPVTNYKYRVIVPVEIDLRMG